MTVSWAGELAAVVAGAAESWVARPPAMVGVVESWVARLPDELETVELCSTADAEVWGASVVTSMVL